MEFNEYVKLCKRTLSMNGELANDVELHSAIGLSTEANELLDAYKKARFYGRELNTQNIKEEIGDILWYLAILCDKLDYSFDKAMIDNIAKLEKRYTGNLFEDIIDRNQEQELSHIDK